MIDQIQIRNIALIKEADITFSPGLTVITGETGSGKTALLSALKLLVGERSDRDAVRDGEDSARVGGRFYIQGYDNEDGVLAVRTLSKDGRSRVTVDGEMSTVKNLAALVGSTMDLCGQHENQRFLSPAYQLSLIDRWAGESGASALHAYKSAFASRKEALEELNRLKSLQSADREQLENARFVLRRIGEVNPHEGEYEELLAESRRLEHAEAFAQYSSQISESLSGDEGALTSLSCAVAALNGLSSLDGSYEELAQSLSGALFTAEDVAREVSVRQEDGEFDPYRFEELQERIVAFQGLLRAYGPTMEEVFAAQQRAREIVSVADGSTEALEQAAEQLKVAEDALRSAGLKLSEERTQASEPFANQVAQVMAELKMADSVLSCKVEPLPFDQWTAEGPDSAEFLFAASRELSFRPLRKIASGGELSRVMLSIKTAMGAKDEEGSLVFDEIDAGVGGKTALALAQVLKTLSSTHQVIVVTHLAQIAVEGDAHLLVEKSKDLTTIREIEGEERKREIARMLSGDESEASMAHAQELLGK